jgi:hypothetical protein
MSQAFGGYRATPVSEDTAWEILNELGPKSQPFVVRAFESVAPMTDSENQKISRKGF